MKHPARPALHGIHVVGTQARDVQNNGPDLCTYHAALKSQELEDNGNLLTISRRFVINHLAILELLGDGSWCSL
jgi:hypothetical protein